MVRHYLSHTHDEWDEHLDMADSAINDAWQESVILWLSLVSTQHLCPQDKAAEYLHSESSPRMIS